MARSVFTGKLAQAWQSSSSLRTHYNSALHCTAYSPGYSVTIPHYTQPASRGTEPPIREALVPRSRPSRNGVPTSSTGPRADTRSYKDCWASGGARQLCSRRSRRLRRLSARYASLTTHYHSRLVIAFVPFFITCNVQQYILARLYTTSLPIRRGYTRPFTNGMKCCYTSVSSEKRPSCAIGREYDTRAAAKPPDPIYIVPLNLFHPLTTPYPTYTQNTLTRRHYSPSKHHQAARNANLAAGERKQSPARAPLHPGLPACGVTAGAENQVPRPIATLDRLGSLTDLPGSSVYRVIADTRLSHGKSTRCSLQAASRKLNLSRCRSYRCGSSGMGRTRLA